MTSVDSPHVALQMEPQTNRESGYGNKAKCSKTIKDGLGRCDRKRIHHSNLTPELRRTALRNGGVLHASTQAEPRSGLGLNELLARRPFWSPAFSCAWPDSYEVLLSWMIGQGVMELSPKPAVKRSESNSRGPTRTRTVTEVRGPAL